MTSGVAAGFLLFTPLSDCWAGAMELPNAWQITDVSAATGTLFYTNTLTVAQKIAATNAGWHFTVVSRLVEGSPNASPGQFMIYGTGERRFNIGWDTNAAGEFTARLTLPSSITIFTNLTAPGQAAKDYHRHELVYDPATRQATYLFDGRHVYTWEGLTGDSNFNGQALWGAAANTGRGAMNYHQVKFAINGLGTVTEYFAGLEGNPPVAPSPTIQGWTLTWTVPTSTVVTNAAVSPDIVAVPCRPIALVDSHWAGTQWGADPDGAGPATSFGWDAFASYEDAHNAVCADGTIQVVRGDIEIVDLQPASANSVRIVFEDLAGLGQGAGCLYTLQTASNLATPTAWPYVQTLGLEDLGGGRHQFIAPTVAEAQRYYRIVVWTTAATDTDHDGLADSLETALGTHPNKFDTDGDGFNDCLEITLRSNALDPNSLPPVSAFAQAEFASKETVVLESNATVRIRVTFDRPYRGELLYEIEQSSNAGANDFTDLSTGQVAVNGTQAEILLRLKEDVEVEPVETIAISLLQNTNAYYRRGASLSHAVAIVDNDVNWAGTFVSPGMVSRFNLQVLRNGNQNTGWLQPAQAGTQSLGTIPAPPAGQLGWSFVNWTNTSTDLQAVTVPIPVGPTRLFGGQALQRVINLSAIPPASTNNPYFFTNVIVRGLDLGPVIIGGRYTDTLTPVGGAAGNCGGLQGVFTLTREIPAAPALAIPFVNP